MKDIVVGFTHEELKEAFDKVADPKDWKKPISRVVNADENIPLIMLAIEFFTATKAEIAGFFSAASRSTGPFGKPTTKDGIYIKAVGYRNGPAGG